MWTLPLAIKVPDNEACPLVLNPPAEKISSELDIIELLLIVPEAARCPLVSIPVPNRRPEPERSWVNCNLDNLRAL